MKAWMRDKMHAAAGLDEVDIVRRALALRKQKRIGVLFAEQGRYYVSENELDPYGTRQPVSLVRLAAMVSEIEETPIRKGAQCEHETRTFEKTISAA